MSHESGMRPATPKLALPKSVMCHGCRFARLTAECCATRDRSSSSQPLMHKRLRQASPLGPQGHTDCGRAFHVWYWVGQHLGGRAADRNLDLVHDAGLPPK